MALNMDKVRNKLASYDKTKKGGNGKRLSPEQQDKAEKIKKYIWKPEPGQQIVRIVPYQYQPDFPFIELKWHYDFNGDKVSYLSPSSINKPDPIVELASRLEKTRETWLKGRKLQPKTRTYVPIVIRGKEDEGVKFWGFGARVHEQLLAAISEPDYGDITDLNNGYDIRVDFKTAEELKADFPDTKILIKPKSCPVIDHDNARAREIMELITKKQPDIFDIYTPASYEELVAALEVKLENERNGTAVAAAPRGAARTVTPSTTTSDDNVVYPSEAQIESATKSESTVLSEVAPSTPPVSPSAQKAKKVDVADFEAAFKDLFPDKK